MPRRNLVIEWAKRNKMVIIQLGQSGGQLIEIVDEMRCGRSITANINIQSRMMKLVLCTLLIILACSQYYEADRVHETVTNYSGHAWYSGYLSIGKEKNYHYIFFTSQHDPDMDPLVVWYNGGPGCSALLGMTTELGPFIFPKNSTKSELNPHSWNKQANLLFIESPGSVGFSVGPYEHSDESTAADNLQTLLEFFSKFPIMRKNQLHLSGESYAGVYVPYLAKQIHEYNQHHGNLFKINLKGIIVGNACTHRSQCYDPRPGTSMHQYQFLYNHAFYNTPDYTRLRAACVMAYQSAQCKTIRAELDEKFEKTFTNLYSIYDKCYDSHPPEGGYLTQSGNLKEGADCNPSKGSEQFFNNPVHRDFLHVYQHFNGTWTPCNHNVYKYYKKNENQSYAIYPVLMKAGYRVWVYSGDTDADVPITGTKYWIQQLREQFHVPVMEPWREWWVYGRHAGEDQVGGMVWKLRNLTFVSVKNAGHMVPQDQPAAALVMLNTYLRGEDLPEHYEI